MADQLAAHPQRHGGLRGVGRWLVLEIALLVALLCFLTGSPVGFAVGAAVVVIAAVLMIPIGGRSLLSALRARLAYGRRTGNRADTAGVPYDLVPLAQWVPGLAVSQTLTGRGDEVGVITDGTAWSAVLALSSDEHLLADKGEELNLAALSGLTRQDDVVFEGVQVVTYTVPAPTTALLGPNSPAGQAYREVTAGQVPPTVQRTWLCVRLDPRLCIPAVTRRGAGSDGIYATLRFGLHRVQTVLKRQGIETRALNPVEIYEVLALTSGSGPDAYAERSREDWQHWTCDGLLHTGRVITGWGASASLGYGRLLQAVASAPVLFAITSYTLSPKHPATGGIRLVTPNEATAGPAVDHVTAVMAGEVRFGPAGGAQVPTMLATVPLGRGAVA